MEMELDLAWRRGRAFLLRRLADTVTVRTGRPTDGQIDSGALLVVQ